MNNESQNIHILFEQYIDECTYIKQLRRATITGYSDVFRQFTLSFPRITNTHDLVPQLVTEFLRKAGVHGSRLSTIHTYYNKLIVFFRWLEEQNHLDQGFCKQVIKPPAPKYEDDKALKEADISKIISAIASHGTDSALLFKRDMLIVHILLYTGIRKGELMGLRVQDVDLFSQNLYINGATSKSKKSRQIPISKNLLRHLKSYLDERHKSGFQGEALLISPHTNSAFTQHGLKHWVNKYKKLSGVHFHVHQFRHTLACTMAKHNADIVSIKSVLGHASIKMTERYLRSIRSENARGVLDHISY
jgi:integrase